MRPNWDLARGAQRRILLAVRERKTSFRIVPADSEKAVAEARLLFREYAAALSVDLCFQNFDKELAGLPGDYAPPTGRLYLALVNSVPGTSASSEPRKSSAHAAPEEHIHLQEHTGAAGCVALRQFDATSGEMKRLYVRAAIRGQGVARGLVGEVMRAAREIGYRKILLDTLPEMAEAQLLYRSLGFREVPPYRAYSVPGVRFFALSLF